MTNLNYQVESCSAGEENTSMCVRETKIPRVNSNREEQIQFLRFIAFLNVFCGISAIFAFSPIPHGTVRCLLLLSFLCLVVP